MNKIFAYLFLLLSCTPLHTYSKSKIDTAVSLAEALKAQNLSLTISTKAELFNKSLSDLAIQHKTVLTKAAQPISKQTINELNKLSHLLKQSIKLAAQLKATTHTISSCIKPVSYIEEKEILHLELNSINRQIIGNTKQKLPISEALINRKKTLEEKIKLLTLEIKKNEEAARKAAKNYIILSKSLKQRVHIYAAPRVNPTAFGKKPIKSIGPNKSVCLLACNPELVYKIKIRNQIGTAKKGRIIYNYHTLKRSGSKSNTFSIADKGHQLIINNYHQYSIHSMKYQGKGSIKQQRVQNIALLVTCCVVVALAAAATGGAAGLAVASLAGPTETAFGIAVIATTGGALGSIASSPAIIGGSIGAAQLSNAINISTKDAAKVKLDQKKPTTPPPSMHTPTTTQE